MQPRTVDSDPSDARSLVRTIRALTAANPKLANKYDEAKRTIRVFRKPAFYEVTERCNLFCEGCYYFEDDERQPRPERESIEEWERFFAAEAQRQVSIAYFVGAEPALAQERLAAASAHFPYANIGTNGTIRIDPSIPYRIAISIWAADDGTDRKLRGASVFRKALKNYRGDPRAIVLFTMSRWNMAEARIVAEMCQDNGVPLTFNMYSPTATFLNKLATGHRNDRGFFRVSRSHDHPGFSDEDLVQSRRIIAELLNDFPETIIYSNTYHEWATRPGPLYNLEQSTGSAMGCGSRLVGEMRMYGADLLPKAVKCCTPGLDCSHCRMYSGGWSSKLQAGVDDLIDAETFSAWMDLIGVIARIFTVKVDAASEPSAKAPSIAA